ncbi:MAG: hypothetical protein ABIE55_04170 [Candidatus Aenigmatarchaeota archaeon]
MIVKKSERKKHANTPSCIAYEYGHKDKDIDVAFIEIRGRYPERGRVVSKVSKEMIFISKGNGKIEIDGEYFDLNEGDAIIIQPNQKYFFEGKLDLVFSCNPSWNPENYENVD